MTTATNTAVEDELEDPDNPVSSRGKMFARFDYSLHIDVESGVMTPEVTDTAERERILTKVRNFAEKSGNYRYSVWFMEYSGISVIREDGTPFRQSDIIKLRSKEGNKLGSNQAHAKLAEIYRNLGVSASYVQVGAENSAVGRIFEIGDFEIDLGKNKATGQSFKKPVQTYPFELMPTDWVFEGEARIVKPKGSDGDDEGAAADGGAGTALSEADALAVLKTVLAGKTPGEMMDAVLAEPQLANVATIFGVPLLEAATDESLVTVLQENRAMALNGEGVMVAL